MKFNIIILFFLFLGSSASAQYDYLQQEIEIGNYESAIEKAKVELKKTDSNIEKFQLYELMAEAYLNLGYFPDYLKNIQQSGKYNPNKKTAEILYNIEIAIYYHGELITDSSTFFAYQSMQLLRANWQYADSNLITKVYANYGNIMRNGGRYHIEVANANINMNPRNNLLKSYLDTALAYATTDYQKINIYTKIGSVYLDCVAGYHRDSSSIKKDAFITSNNYYRKAIQLLKNDSKIASVYALIGLNHHYLFKYKKADSLYQLAKKYTKKNDVVIHRNEYIAIQNWRGWNLEDWYKKTNDLELLKQAHNVYQNSLVVWHQFYERNKDNSKGYNDGYQVSSLNRLVSASFSLFKATNDSSYLNLAFDYAEQAKYPTFKSKSASMIDIQSLLDENTAFVHYTFVPRPSRHIVFVILKNSFQAIEFTQNIDLDSKKLNFLYQFNDIQLYKEWSYNFYTNYFATIDAVLSKYNIQHVIVSNSDECSMLNLDLLISDTLSNSWKDQPYLFHKYNFSYALSGRSFVESYKNSSDKASSFGLTTGNYTKEVNLRFSKKLAKNLVDDYNIQRSDFEKNISQNNIAMVLLHGNSSYYEQQGEVMLSSTNRVTVDDIFVKNLDNDLIIFTACNTNASQQFHGEGATGNFSKAFRYAGAKSTITTSWAIDDKANAFIMKQFIHYLADGLPKNEALYRAKKEYWKQCSVAEEFKPLYWSPYILTGNLDAVGIEKKSNININWLWLLLLLPIGYLSWKKFN